MANHGIDCEICGQDQRSVGSECCPQYVESERERDATYQAKVDADTEYLAKFGLRTWENALGYRTKLDAADVVVFLKERFKDHEAGYPTLKEREETLSLHGLGPYR